ncbi:MAG TPA: adenosine deaminase [Spirochaetia bacterium]|nr:adenosine deaminase [Spirochaetia bacterium]
MKSEPVSDVHQTLTDPEVMRSFPKIELHRHLEGTFALETLHRMALRNGLDFPTEFEGFQKLVQFPVDSEPDFLKFLSLFHNNWYRSLDDVAEIVHDSVADLVNDGLTYIELRFSPEHFADHNGFERGETARAVMHAADAAARETGIEIRYLITFNRSKQTQEQMADLYHLLRDLEEPAIVGLDLAGDELNYPPELFGDFFAEVRGDGIYRTTIHAGEVTPPQQIWDAIRELGANRIGHGVAAIHDPELQSYLRDHDIVLEQCITSNYQTGSWADERNHPLGALHRAGVPVTINSDDPSIQNASLTDDYVKAVSYFNLTMEDLVTLNERAIDAAFLTDAEKQALRKKYQRAVAGFRSANNL